MRIRTEKTTTCPTGSDHTAPKGLSCHKTATPAQNPGTPETPSTPQKRNTCPKAPARRIGAQKIRGAGCTSDPNARLLAKKAAARGNHDSNPYQPQKQAKANLSQPLRSRAPSQPLQKRTSSQAGYTNRTPASGPGVMEYTSSTCIQHTPLE